MTNRTVAVSLTAQVSSYISNFKAAEQATRNTGNAAEDAQKKFQNQNQAMTQVGVGLVAFGAIAAAAVGLAVAKYAEFDQAMSAVQAATHESTENMTLLRNAAIDAGASTVFTAKEAANAIEELAKAGVSTADILKGGLSGALDLASAGGLAVADAAQIAATAMTQFNLAGEQVPHVADLLAAGAGKAQGSVDDLSQALNQGGLVASQAGFSIEETTGVLSAFAAAGLLGSDAGTSLKTSILALENPSTKASAVMDQYKISVYDANGGMLSFADIANQLQTRLGGLDDETRNAALAQIFGNDAVRAANVLYANGSKGITEWTNKVNDTGYAAETARIKLDNLNGDVEKLGGAFDSVLIKTGSGANDALRFLVQTATDLVDSFGAAPPLIQQGALALTAITAAAALAGGAFLIGVPKIAEFSVALATLSSSEIPAVASAATTLSSSLTRAGSAFSAIGQFLTGPWGVATAAAGVGIALLTQFVKAGQSSAEELTNALLTAKSAADLLGTAAKSDGVSSAVFGDYKDALSDLPNLLNKVKDGQDNVINNLSITANEYGAINSLRSLGKSLGELASSDLPAAQSAMRELRDSYGLTDQQALTLINTMSDYKNALQLAAGAEGISLTSGTDLEKQQNTLAIAFGTTSDQTQVAAKTYSEAAEQIQNLQQQILDLITTVNDANKIGQDAVSSNAAYQESLAKVDEYIVKLSEGTEGYSAGLDESTAAGSANAAMLQGLAADSQAAALAQFNLDGNTDNYRATLEAGRQAVIDRAQQLGATAEQAQALADKIYAIPSEKQFTMIAETAAANQQIQHVLDLLASVPASRQTSVGVTVVTDEIFRVQKAAGGAIYGPGGPRDDRVPAMLSNGEHVLTASDVAALGGQAGVYAMRAGLHNGYAFGGAVQPTYGGGGGRVSVSPQVSLAGARIVLEVGGRQIEGVIREQIVAADQQSNVSSMMGVQ